MRRLHPIDQLIVFTILLLLSLIAFGGCAHIQPIPCRDLNNPTATGERAYPHLCSSSSIQEN